MFDCLRFYCSSSLEHAPSASPPLNFPYYNPSTRISHIHHLNISRRQFAVTTGTLRRKTALRNKVGKENINLGETPNKKTSNED